MYIPLVRGFTAGDVGGRGSVFLSEGECGWRRPGDVGPLSIGLPSSIHIQVYNNGGLLIN